MRPPRGTEGRGAEGRGHRNTQWGAESGAQRLRAPCFVINSLLKRQSGFRTRLFDVYISRETSLVAQMIKRLPIMQETQVRSLGREDPLEKEMATYSSILAWKIPLSEEPNRLQSMGSQRVGHN